MKVFKSGIYGIYISSSTLREYKGALGEVLYPIDRIICETCLGLGIGDYSKIIDKNFLNFCKTFSRSKSEFNIGILSAHGEDFFGKWYYWDGVIPKSVQKWIDEYDGIYDLLLIHSCNPKNRNPVIKKSLAVVPTGEFSILRSVAGFEHKLVIPGKGSILINKKKIEMLPEYDLLKDLQPYTPNSC